MYQKFLLFCLLVVSIAAAEDADNVLTKDVRVPLNSGEKIPLIGYGTGGLGGIQGADVVKEVLDEALGAGYRLFDTAEMYKNEEEIGKALKELLPKYNLTRKDVFITSKLGAKVDSYGEHAYEALKKSVERLGFGYIDLYLIHFPGYFPEPSENYNFSKARDETWKQLVKGHKEGLAKSIGVSNYNIRHLTELLSNDYGVKPALNQVEFHAEYHQDDLLQFCKKEGIVFQAYFSLGGVKNKTSLLQKPEVVKIANDLGKTPAQVLLRWAVQQDVLVIPKSRNRKHMEQNLDLNFVLSEENMRILSSFKQDKYIWNPDKII